MGTAYVYVLHGSDGSHYIGSTSTDPVARLSRHRSGRGSRWVYNRIKNGVQFSLGYVQTVGDEATAFRLERYYKEHRRKLTDNCEVCKKCRK